VTSFGRLKDVALPTIPGLVFEAIGRSQGFDFGNGTVIPASFILIRVTPQFAGVFSIPGLTPNSRSIGLEVVKGDEPNPYTWRSQQPAPAPVPTASLPKGVQLQAGGAAFVHLAIPARPIYVGESVPVEIGGWLTPGIVTSMNGCPRSRAATHVQQSIETTRTARRGYRRWRLCAADLAQRSPWVSYLIGLCRRVLSRAHSRANHAVNIAGRNHLKHVACNGLIFTISCRVLMQQIEIQMLGVESGDKEFARTSQVNRIGSGGRQCAMPQLDELDATLVALSRILEKPRPAPCPGNAAALPAAP